MLKVIIFGATGGTGQETLKLLRSSEQFHTTAFVRDPAKLACSPSVEVIKGDVRDDSSVSSALSSSFDAVFIILGGKGIWSPDDTCSIGTKNILKALKATQQKPKLIVCSSMGVRETRNDIPSFVRWLLKYPLADKDIQENDVESCGLPYVIVRPSGLRDGPGRGLSEVAAVEKGPTPTSSIARADVASFMISQLGSPGNYANNCVGISWKK